MKPRSWKTTTWGIAAIVLFLGNAVLHFHQTGQIDMATTISTLGSLAAAAGLIPAADNSELKK